MSSLRATAGQVGDGPREHPIGDHAIPGLVMAIVRIHEPERVHPVDLADERRMLPMLS